MPDIGWYGLVLVVAAGATAAFTVPARRLSLRVGYVAAPNERTMHKMPIPYGGGAAMFLGFLVAVLAAAAIPALRSVFVDSPEMLGVVLAAGAIFAVGLIDDVRDMSAPAKLAGQILAASILYFLGVTMYQFKVPLAGFIVLTPGIIPLITAAWVIALANAINLIDGLDGLAAGIVAIGGGALAIYGIRLMALGILPTGQRGPPGGRDRLRHLPGVPPVQFHARPACSWGTPARSCWVCSWRPRPWSSEGGPRPPAA